MKAISPLCIGALFFLSSGSATAAVESIELDANFVSRKGKQMVVEVGERRLTLPAPQRAPSSATAKTGKKIRIKILPSELK
jgi:hypothetical protein